MAPPTLESDTWYRLYIKNNLGSHYLTTLPNGTSVASKDKTIYNLWQVLTHDNGHFSFRQNRTQVDWWQLGTYVDPYGGLAPDTKTQLQVMTNDTSQQWNIVQWGEELPWKITNVELGEAVMDCHRDNARIFIQPQPQTTLVNERWYFTSVAKIQGTTTTSTATTTTASSPRTAKSTAGAGAVTITSFPASSPTSLVQEEESSAGGLSTGAKAGIGVGVSLVSILLLASLLWLLVRRRKTKAKRPPTGTIDSTKSSQLPGNNGGEGSHPYFKPQLPGQGISEPQPSRSGPLSELQATPDARPTELPANSMARKL